MPYIFISYAEHLEQASRRKEEFYNLSLKEQYELLIRRIPENKRAASFQSFINNCFPSGLRKRFYISCPNFLRDKKQSDDNQPSYLNNVVLRPELTLSMRGYLPDNQNIILIGDISEGDKMKKFVVKGIQFIDDNMSSPNDIIVNAQICVNFEKNSKTWSVPGVDWNDTILTPNFVTEIIESCRTVKNPAEVRQTYELWKQYMDFRKYYLDEQSKRNFKLDSCEYIESFAVNRKDYRKNSSVYDDYILDGVEDFKRGDMVVLNQKIEEAEAFPLIRLNIDRNRKLFNEAKVLRRGKSVNEEERKIRSLANDNVFITKKDPNSKSEHVRDKKTNELKNISFGELINAGYTLGDKFRIVSYDIEPTEHLEELEKQHDDDINETCLRVDLKYEKIISDELKLYKENYVKELDKIINDHITNKKVELESSLDFDIRNNQDKDILSQIESIKTKIKNEAKKNLKQEKDELDFDYEKRLTKFIESEYEKINIRSLYVERNEKSLEKFSKLLKIEEEKEITKYVNQKNIELNNKYKSDIRNEKIAEKERLDYNFKKECEKAIEEETIKRFSLYFRLGDPNNVIKQKEKDVISKCQYIVYDIRAEDAKIRRQRQALDNFYNGYVKNPYLSTFLFTPEQLNSVRVEPSDWTWYLDSLNEKQKEAVRKAVSSNGIFLLQGPPGTGKTQVIAETVAQMVKKGKKVLVSSETHKAIDNVFERLPKIAEIVPIRLIPSNNRKNDNEYDPKFLVDNFYLNIRTRMQKAVDRYKNFKRNKEEFSETFEALKLLKAKVDKKQKVLDEANKKIKLLEENAIKINKEISNFDAKKDDIIIEIDILKRIKRHIENDNLKLDDDDIKRKVILDYRKEYDLIFDPNEFALDDLGTLLKNINAIKPNDIEREIALVDPNSNRTLLEIEKKDISKQIAQMEEEYDYEIPSNLVEKYQKLKARFREVKKQIDASCESSISNLKLNDIFKPSFMVAHLDDIKKIVEETKDKILEIKGRYYELLINEINDNSKKCDDIDREINLLKVQIKDINRQIEKIQDNDDVKQIQEDKYKLESKLNQFFKDFEISEPYDDIDSGLEIISKKWNELETDYSRKETENKEKIPMYEKISNYLAMEDVIEEDRKTYTKELFENANVFGITCTSNDRFSGDNVDALSEYNIDDINLKTVGIDVVIIDEVSKSSFIDLLIPILYGKTVILVGDHRQLPPMYEFARLRDEDFEGLDENIINKDINAKFTKLYEECFFKTLFEKIPDSYKTMLVQQYRCHEHIMKVFNHFYQGELKLGFDGQNNKKQHNIKLISNGRTIIEPNKHIYFIDCKKFETHEQDSTSMYNTGEAMVVVEMIKKINDFFKKNPSREKLSIGVICTYGDQARKIKELMKSEKVKTDAFKTDVEKMIVSTVDDFQGDERDIIILSMVRNPENPNRSDPGFILKYQRVNVALSRARRLLIMVGNRRYLENKGVIDLPDVNGRAFKDRKNFRIYEEIISTIEQYGKVIDDGDVLEEKEARING